MLKKCRIALYTRVFLQYLLSLQLLDLVRPLEPPLTLFLHVPGAPLDNNICERALKKAILNRKNALFYKTERGARVGDLYMSLIHTCELNKTNPFDYLVALRENASEVERNPEQWMPWNYERPLAQPSS